MTYDLPITGYQAQWQASAARLRLIGRAASLKGWAKGRQPVPYFHRVDDPMSHLMAGALLPLIQHYNLALIPHVVEKLPARYYPDPARYEAWTVIDAEREARRLGLDMPDRASVPDRLTVQMATLHLSGVSDPEAFLSAAIDLGRAVWSGDVGHVRRTCQMADMDPAPLRRSETLLKQLGGYSSATLVLAGEHYTGVDRLKPFLAALTGDDVKARDPFTDQRLIDDILQEAMSGKLGRLAGQKIDIFLSLLCPYSYLAIRRLRPLLEASGAGFRIRPVEPAINHPDLKWRYMLRDVGRLARGFGMPFLTGPLKPPNEMQARSFLGAGLALRNQTQRLAYFDRVLSGVWGTGRLPGPYPASLSENPPLKAAAVDAEIALNTADMRRAGLWGTPSFIVNGTGLWGQDRLGTVIAAAIAAPVNGDPGVTAPAVLPKAGDQTCA